MTTTPGAAAMNTTYRKIVDNINNHLEDLTHNGPKHIRRLTITGETREEVNRTHAYANPSYRSDYHGTQVAYLETEYTYRGDEWTVEAYAAIHDPKPHQGIAGNSLSFEIQTAHNLTKRTTYGRFESANLTTNQHAAAVEALAKITGTTHYLPGKYAPITITKKDTLHMIEAAALYESTHEIKTYQFDRPDDYARSFRSTAEYQVRRALDNGRKAHGHTITDTDKETMTARIVKHHKRTLAALARAL